MGKSRPFNVWEDNMKTYILTLNLENGERKDLECIEGNVYASYEELREKVGSLAKEINIYPLTDFMDACNDQEIALDEIWVGYVHVQEDTRELPFSFTDYDYEETRDLWDNICSQLDVDADDTTHIVVEYVKVHAEKDEL